METKATTHETEVRVVGAAMDPRARLRMAWRFALGLPAWVLVFWAVAWGVTAGGQVPQSPEVMTVEAARGVWAAVALLTIAGAFLCRVRAVGAAHDAVRSGQPGAGATKAQLWLLAGAVLIETLGLVTGMFLVMLGTTDLLWYTLPLYAAGVGATLPRAEWFGVDPRTLD